MKVVQVNKSIQLIDDSVIKITKNFAENNLSKTCLKYAENVTDKHYFWTLDEFGYAVLFEIPTEFNAENLDFAKLLSVYSMPYMQEMKITRQNYRRLLKKNINKEIVFDNRGKN